MRWPRFILLNLLFAVSCLARQATVSTRDNRISHGETFFHGADTLIVTPPVGAAFRVALANINEITFSSTVVRVESSRTMLALRNGSVTGAMIRSMDDTAVKLTIGNHALSIPTLEVARVIFQPVSDDYLAKLSPARQGVLLTSGDFLDGRLLKFDGNELQLNTTTFGLRTLSVTNEAAALILRPSVSSTNLWEVQVSDGSIFQTETITPELDQILINDQKFGAFRVPLNQLLRIRRNRP